MSALSPASKKAIANLRAFTASPTNYYKCPLARRAAVLILLFADLRGDLRVVLTIRSAGLKNYAGQAALPGGKADTLAETPFQTARREAFEEIGLPMSDDKLPPGYTVEHLTELPTHLAMTELGVRPCVAYLKAPPIPSSPSSPPSSSSKTLTGDAAKDILPTLDAREVAAVFTAPFANLLSEHDVDPSVREKVPGEWYKGSWHSWHETAWRMHQFFVPVFPSSVFLARGTSEEEVKKREERRWKRRKTLREEKEKKSRPQGESAGLTKGTGKAPAGKVGNGGQVGGGGGLNPPLPREFYRPLSQPPPQQTSGNSRNSTGAGDVVENADPLRQPRYRVFGMTARILVDCARVAYGREPEFEHNSHFGDEDMIERLIRIGRLGEVRKQGEMLTRDVMIEAARAKI